MLLKFHTKILRREWILRKSALQLSYVDCQWISVLPFRNFFKSLLEVETEELHIISLPAMKWGRDSTVGIAPCYGLDGQGSNPCGVEIFPTRPDWPWGPPNLLYNGYRIFPGGKMAGRGVDHHPHLVPRLKIE